MTTRARRRRPASIDRDDYARRLEAFLEEEASARHRAPADGPPALGEVLERHEGLFGAGQVDALSRLAETQHGEDAAETRRLLSAAIVGHLRLELRELDTSIADAERRAIVVWRSEQLRYPQVPLRVAEIASRAERNGLDSAYQEAVEAINPLRGERSDRRRELLAALGHEDEATLVGALAGFDPAELAVQAQAFLSASETVYYAALRRYLARIDIEQGDGSLADVAHVLRGSGWDALFPPRRLIGLLPSIIEPLGVAVGEALQIEVADADPQATAAWFDLRVPGDLRLRVSPAPGVDAYRRALHTLGHAAHRAAADAELPLGARRLGDPAVAAGYAFLFEDLLLEPRWLVEALRMDEGAIVAFGDFAAFGRLYRLRREAALYLYELRLGPATDASLARAYYAGMLSLLTGVHVPEAGYLTVVGKGLTAATRLRGSFLASRLAAALRERHGPSWWREADAGETLRRAWSRGSGWPAQDVVAHLGYDRLDWRPVLRLIRTQLIGELSGYGGPNITTRAGTRKV
jgi:hypothetical protein